MTHPTLDPESWLNELSPDERSQVQTQLQADENVSALLQVDLDSQLNFVPGWVLVTNRRLLTRAPDGSWQAWAYRPGLLLTHHDHAGVGHLALNDSQGRLAAWCFTLGHNLQAIRLLDQFQILAQSAVTGLPPALLEGRHCPSCKAPLAPDQNECQ